MVSNICCFHPTPIWWRFPFWLQYFFQMGWNHQPVQFQPYETRTLHVSHVFFSERNMLWKVLVDTFMIVSRLSKMVKLAFDLHHSKVVSYRLSFRVVDKTMWIRETGWGGSLTKVQSNFKEHVSWWNWWHFHPRQYHFVAPFAPLSTSPALSSGVALIWTLLCAWGSSFAPHLLLDLVTFDVSSV